MKDLQPSVVDVVCMLTDAKTGDEQAMRDLKNFLTETIRLSGIKTVTLLTEALIEGVSSGVLTIRGGEDD